MPREQDFIRVLSVDDQQIALLAIQEALSQESDIHFCGCKEPALALQIAEEYNPSVVLLDLVMPVIDGLQLLGHFRANPRVCRVPIIILSSQDEPHIKAEAFSRGANDYLIKFPPPAELISRIRFHAGNISSQNYSTKTGQPAKVVDFNNLN
jgi:PleD family two-component response regulator